MFPSEFRSEVSGCIKCGLHTTRANVVFGSGNPSARVMLVGEAPGSKEDDSGLPFVGAAGSVLEECLASIGLNRDDLFITNVVKCRPPENRNPELEEIEACREWLDRQIELVDPKVIVCMGNFAAGKFFSDRISRVHGKGIKRDRLYYATYHPAAALRSSERRKDLFEDFRKLRIVLDSIEV